MFGALSFRGGVLPQSRKKATAGLPIEAAPLPSKAIIPLVQHMGAPARPTVKVGDRVGVGSQIGEAAGHISAAVHSSVSGTVAEIGVCLHPLGQRIACVVIDNDGSDVSAPRGPATAAWQTAEPAALREAVAAAGIVGMGGAAFPTHVKLSPPSGIAIDTLIVNGAECEPYLSGDHRLMVERAEHVLVGALIAKRILGANRAVVGVETDKRDALSALAQAVKGAADSELAIVKLRCKYPQGGERELVEAITRREVPSGGLPINCGCLVLNVGTVCAIRDAVLEGKPLYERVLTVAGPTVARPRNLLVRVGTPVRQVLEYCGADLAATAKVVLGGPMMGTAVADLDTPVTKAVCGIVALNSTTPADRDHECIGCGNCFRACPLGLVPSVLAKYVRTGAYDDADRWGITDCMRCGACAYVCPSKINLVHYLMLGRFHVQSRHVSADA